MKELFSLPLEEKISLRQFKEFLSNATISQRNLCNMPLNSIVVSKRKKTENLELDYLEGHYVRRVLTFVFGTKWESIITLKETQTSFHNNKHSAFTSVTTKLLVEWEDGSKTSFMDVGHGTGTSNYSLGDAVESAEKEAVTDSLKRCAISLGDPFGLILYNKEKMVYPHRFTHADYGTFDKCLRELNAMNKELSVDVGKFLLRFLNKRLKEDIAEAHEFMLAVKVCEYVKKLVSINTLILPEPPK